MHFAVAADHRINLKVAENKDKYLDLARELNKTLERKGDDYANCKWCSWYSHQRIGTRTRGLGNNGTSGDCPNYSIDEIGQKTEKILGHLRRFAVTQTPVENYQLALM